MIPWEEVETLVFKSGAWACQWCMCIWAENVTYPPRCKSCGNFAIPVVQTAPDRFLTPPLPFRSPPGWSATVKL